MELNEPLVSIIIPVYNAQCYLERCLVALMRQTYRNLEIIMVDDGSTDHSPEICTKYLNRDNRFRLITQKNSGVSRARNKGIRMATGKYIMFSDSDDWFRSDAVRKFVERAESDGSDMVVSGFNRIINTVKIPMATIKRNSVMTREEFAGEMADSPADFYFGVLWNKCYRTSIIKGKHIYCSPRYRWCEDFLFNLEYMQYTRKISVINDHLYYYVKRLGSICESQIKFSTMIAFKMQLLGYYRALYKSINLYDDNKFKINSYLFAYAHDSGTNEYNQMIARQKMDSIKKITAGRQKTAGGKKGDTGTGKKRKGRKKPGKGSESETL